MCDSLVNLGFIRLTESYSIYGSKKQHYDHYPFTNIMPENRAQFDKKSINLLGLNQKLISNGYCPKDIAHVNVFDNSGKRAVVTSHHDTIDDMLKLKLSDDILESTEIMSNYNFIPENDILSPVEVEEIFGDTAKREGRHPLKVCLASGKVGSAPNGYALYSPLHVFQKLEDNLL